MMRRKELWKTAAIALFCITALLFGMSHNYNHFQPEASTKSTDHLKADGVGLQSTRAPEKCVTPEFNFTGASQEDPLLIEYIRKELMNPPSPRPYKLKEPKKLHYSQLGQSKHANDNYFHGMRNGFFIEVGAVDGESLSNSLYFEKELGWRGLLIEPNPITYKSLLAKNRKAYSINSALALTPAASEATFKPSGHLGWTSRLSNKGIKVKCMPLYSLLRALDVKVIDFLSLDIESMEVKVLKTIPWDKVKFRLMVIEYNHIPEGLEYMTKYLTSKGYKYLGARDIDAWYGWPELLDERNPKTTRKH